MGNSNLRLAGQSGFAYLWTLMLIAFMGVALSIGGHLYETGVRRDKERELLFVGQQFRQAIGRYYATGLQQYPSSLEELLADPRQPGNARYLRKIYADPMTGKPDWGLIKVNGKIAGVYSQSTQTPIKQANFKPGTGSLVGKKRYSDWVFAYPLNLAFIKPGEDDEFDLPQEGSPHGGAFQGTAERDGVNKAGPGKAESALPKK